MFRFCSSRAAHRVLGLMGLLALVPCPGFAAHRGLGIQAAHLAGALTQAEDLGASGLAFIELCSARDTYLQGEPFVLSLRFGLELEFLANRMVQLFQQALDVPVQAFVPAWETRDDLRLLADAETPHGLTFVLGDTVQRVERRADVVRGGRTYALFECERRAQALRTGPLLLAAPSLGLAYATRFDDDFLQGRLPLDRREGFVQGTEMRLVIAALPEPGRPPEFTGAIGRCTIEAAAVPQDLRLGASLEWLVRITAEAGSEQGSVDLERCGEPRLEVPRGFHPRGRLVERTLRGLTVRQELVPTEEGVFELPPVRFATFDTTPPAGYRTIESAPIPLVVRARAPDAGAAATGPERPLGDTRPESSSLRSWVAFALLALAGLGVLLALRRRARHPARHPARRGH